MKVNQTSLTQDNWYNRLSQLRVDANLFMLFVSPDFKPKQDVLDVLVSQYPNAIIIGCSTSGEISDVTVKDKTMSLTAVQFDKTQLKKVIVDLKNVDESYNAGKELASKLSAEDLKHVIVFSDGLNTNGSDLVSGLKDQIPKISITGGLAGDGPDFKSTFLINGSNITDKIVVGLGLYGDHVKVGCSAKGGWDSYGIERLVTKSKKNVLYEVDNIPALDAYKPFFGDEEEEISSSKLQFPISMRTHVDAKPLVRSILGINEEEKSLTFAGNITEGSYVRLMKGNVDRLINGAEEAAIEADAKFKKTADLAMLVSCVGRRLIFKQMIEEEVEVVRQVLGDKPSITGFYSYGEIGPHGEHSPCELHNKTITITILSEC